jgi:hypothetical protein
VSAELAGRDPPLLDWRDAKHWSWTEKPCRYCGEPTQLRDSKGNAAHKVHAEQALAQQAADAAEAYDTERHLH